MVNVENLVVEFRRALFRKRFRALDGLTLEVREGDFFGLLGRNGAGKSTTMYCLLGLLRPRSGTIRVLGAQPAPGAPLFRDVAYLPEEPSYHSYLTVLEALAYYARLSGVKPTVAELISALEVVDLVEHRHVRIAHCSKGMKQKVGIAQCLIHKPRLLLLDEPMRGLDPVTVRRFRDILVDLNRQGCTVVMNSHILSEVEQVANRVAIIERGRVLVQDELRNLIRVSNDQYSVEVEGAADPLPYLTETARTDTCVAGWVPVQSFYQFIEACQQRNARVVQCALRKTTLEESFLAVLGSQGSAHA